LSYFAIGTRNWGFSKIGGFGIGENRKLVLESKPTSPKKKTKTKTKPQFLKKKEKLNQNWFLEISRN
jgi:hypothetical protein